MSNAFRPSPFAYDSRAGSDPAIAGCVPQTLCDCAPVTETGTSDSASSSSSACERCYLIQNLTDASDELIELFAALLESASADSITKVVIQTPSIVAPIVITKLVTQYASGVHVYFNSPILYGAAGGLRMMGDQPEVIRGHTFKAKLAADADEGDTTLFLSSSGDTMQASDFVVGDAIVIRGQNDASGKALSKQTLHVLARNTLLNTLTVEALEDDYLTVYPDSDWPADLTTGTTISLAAFAQFSFSYGPGTITALVDQTQLASSGIAAGSVVLVSTNEKESDLNANAPYSNAARLEIKKVIAVTATTVTFDTPLIDTYATSKFGGITLYAPITNSEMHGVRATYVTDQTSRNTHGVQLGYGYKSRIVDCHIDGSAGQKGNGIRLSNSLECTAERCRVSNPSHTNSSEGYGVSVYYSDRCRVIECTAEGCRHNFLIQKSNHTAVMQCLSLNDWISGFDVHGVNSINTSFTLCQAIGGPGRSSDATHKSLFRVGNTSHAVGDFNTLIEGCFMSGGVLTGTIATYAALEIFGASIGVVMRGCLAEDCNTGLRAGFDNSADDNIADVIISGNTWTRIGTLRSFQTGPTIAFTNGITRVDAVSTPILCTTAIPVDTSAPTTAEGDLVLTATYTARNPGLIKLTFVCPFGTIAASTDSVIACIFVGSVLVGTAVVRWTVGPSTGEQMLCYATFTGTGVAQTITVRMGAHNPGRTLTLNPAANNWAGANTPFLLIEES